MRPKMNLTFQTKLDKILTEWKPKWVGHDLSGTKLTAYHRTSKLDNINDIMQKGFEPRPGLYGAGLYCVYDLDRAERYPRKLYGKYIIKFNIDISNFLILDPDIAQQVGYSSLNEQFDKFHINQQIPNNYWKRLKYTSNLALNLWKTLGEELLDRVDGIIYTGQQDGRCVLAYNLDIAKPVAYTIETSASGTRKEKEPLKWIKWGDTNQDELRKIEHKQDLKAKQQFRSKWIRNIKGKIAEIDDYTKRGHQHWLLKNRNMFIKLLEAIKDRSRNPELEHELFEGFTGIYPVVYAALVIGERWPEFEKKYPQPSSSFYKNYIDASYYEYFLNRKLF